MLKSTTLSLFVAALVFAVNVSYAAESQGMGNMNMQQDKGNANMQQGMGSTVMQVHKGHGVVKKINAASGKVNISHEPIPSMNWPGMTMDFKVQDKDDLAAIKSGMKVDFDLTVQGKSYKITHIAPAKE